MEDYKAAIIAFDNAIRVKPTLEKAYLLRATAKGLSNDAKGALEDLNKCIALNPNDDLAYFNRGGYKYDNNDKTGACADFAKASELGNKQATNMLKEKCR